MEDDVRILKVVGLIERYVNEAGEVKHYGGRRNFPMHTDRCTAELNSVDGAMVIESHMILTLLPKTFMDEMKLFEAEFSMMDH
jgi:hypothetical protein